MNLIDTINNELQARNWSRKKLSKESGIAPSTLSLKLSQPKLTFEEVEKISAAFGMTTTQLIDKASAIPTPGKRDDREPASL